MLKLIADFISGPAFNTKRFSCSTWATAIRECGLKTVAISNELKDEDLFRLAMKTIEHKSCVLLYHGPNHYSAIGGYRLTKKGGLEFQIAYYGQKPEIWTSAKNALWRQTSRGWKRTQFRIACLDPKKLNPELSYLFIEESDSTFYTQILFSIFL